MAARLKRLFASPGSDINLTDVKEKNALIGDQVIVDGVHVYQDANGAPVETVSPLGYHVGWAGILFLNVSQMVGTGVFSTRELSLSCSIALCYLALSRETQGSIEAYLSCTNACRTAGSILKALDSVGLSILYWVFGAIISAAALAVFLEYAALFPNRSGGQVTYLEQAFPRPAFLFPTGYAFFTIAGFSDFSSSE